MIPILHLEKIVLHCYRVLLYSLSLPYLYFQDLFTSMFLFFFFFFFLIVTGICSDRNDTSGIIQREEKENSHDLMHGTIEKGISMETIYLFQIQLDLPYHQHHARSGRNRRHFPRTASSPGS